MAPNQLSLAMRAFGKLVQRRGRRIPTTGLRRRLHHFWTDTSIVIVVIAVTVVIILMILIILIMIDYL